MKYVENWETIKDRYMQYWNRENHDRPLLWVTAPKNSADKENIIPYQSTETPLNWSLSHYVFPSQVERQPQQLETRWLNAQNKIKFARNAFERTAFYGEAYPLLFPDLGAEIFAAILGCPMELTATGTWCEHPFASLEADCIKMAEDEKWWKVVYDMTRAYVDDGNGDYLVGMVAIHPGLDTLGALVGPEELCMEFYDSPDMVKRALDAQWEIFKGLYEKLYAMTQQHQCGTSNWMGAWYPGKWHTISCDVMTMISRDMFRDIALPMIRKEAAYFDKSIFHLDGREALRHLDDLLDTDEISGIQWQFGAGNPTASHWIDLLSEIQKAGKVVQVVLQPDELDIMLDKLDPEGMLYVIACESDAQARDLMGRFGGR